MSAGVRALALAYAAVDALVIVAPALVLRVDAVRAGVVPSYGLDLVASSAVLGLLHGFIAWRRMARTAASAVRRRDAWIAAIDALVVLSLAATGLLIAVLAGFAGLSTALARSGWAVVALWIALQLVAIIAAELVGRGVFRWLEALPVLDRTD